MALHADRAIYTARYKLAVAFIDHLNVGVDVGVLDRLFLSHPAQPEDDELRLGDAETLGLRWAWSLHRDSAHARWSVAGRSGRRPRWQRATDVR